MRRLVLIAIAFAIASACLAEAQGRREFEVASVKRGSRDALQSNGVGRTPGGLTARNVPFRRLVEMAFQTNQIDWSHVPDSFRSAGFDIVARAAGKIGGDEYWEMLQSLLEDRFQLRHHVETREMRVYAMVLAKKGGGLGPKISASADPDCPVNPTGSSFCGVSRGPGMLKGQRVPMDRVARELSYVAGRAVVDQTGLPGAFDFQLTWTLDENAREAAADAAPSFFPAVQEQLGLKLEPGQGPVEMLVIDRAESPTEN